VQETGWREKIYKRTEQRRNLLIWILSKKLSTKVVRSASLSCEWTANLTVNLMTLLVYFCCCILRVKWVCAGSYESLML